MKFACCFAKQGKAGPHCYYALGFKFRPRNRHDDDGSSSLTFRTGERKTPAEEERASPPLPNFHSAASERSCWTLVPNFPPPLFCSGRNFASLRFRNLISDIPFSDSPRLLFFLCCPNFIHCPLPSFFIILGNRRRRRRKEGRRPWESRALIS